MYNHTRPNNAIKLCGSVLGYTSVVVPKMLDAPASMRATFGRRVTECKKYFVQT